MLEDVVLVTGFGPFGEHSVNASWEVAKLLPSLEFPNVRLIVEQIPVDYEAAASIVPELWRRHSPVLVVHLGVSGMASGLTLEECAHNRGYVKMDINDRTPAGECCSSGPDVLHCELDVKRACRAVNRCGRRDLTSQTSTFAGLYLCEFVYYTSLSIDSSRSLFVHVPTLDKGLTATDLALGVKEIVTEALAQIHAR